MTTTETPVMNDAPTTTFKMEALDCDTCWASGTSVNDHGDERPCPDCNGKGIILWGWCE